jgi:DNA-binding NtrC family response regulator
MIAERFVNEICEDYSITRKIITPKAMAELQQIQWSGNIRELHNVIERLVILSDQKITETEVQNYVVGNKSKANTLEDIFEKYDKFQEFKDFMERVFIEFKLQKNGWNVTKTADEIDIQRSHLYNKIEKYSLRRD